MVVRLTLNSMNPKVVGSNLGLDIIFFSFKPFVCVIYFIIVLFVVVFFSPILFSCGDSITYTRRDHYYQTPCRSIERIEHMTSNCDVTI